MYCPQKYQAKKIREDAVNKYDKTIIQCKCITKSGNRCKNFIKYDGVKCEVHTR